MKLSRLDRGSVVLVAFPFTDLSATKVRPALVISGSSFHRLHGDVILAAISSERPLSRPDATSVLVTRESPEFAGTGLRVNSVIHCGKLVTVRGILVLKHLGRFSKSAMHRVDLALGTAVGLRR